MKHGIVLLPFLLVPGFACGQDLPGCAATGSSTVMIEGRPALRLSDVSMCPPDTYEIIRSASANGEAMVRFKPVHFGKTRCAVMGESTTLLAEGKTVPSGTATHCSSN